MIGQYFYILCGVWALLVLVVFIQAIRLSYRVEARSPDLQNRTGIPRNAMIFHTALNLNVARDPQTQAMRRRMLWFLGASFGGLALMGVAIAFVGSDVPPQ
jgi:hypothetical protein